MSDTVTYRKLLPGNALTDYIACYWHVHNIADTAATFTIFPDGYFDIIFRTVEKQPLSAALSGLWTRPQVCTIPPGAIVYGISFKLLAAEVLLNINIASALNKEQPLPAGYWGIQQKDLTDAAGITAMVEQYLHSLPTGQPDNRKQALFRTLYASDGAVSVQQLAASVHWSARQINRYFTGRFGLPLKTYAGILRYTAAVAQLKKGRMYAEQHYFDQAHFIREVKRYAGDTPKNLAKDKNGRFIQLSRAHGK